MVDCLVFCCFFFVVFLTRDITKVWVTIDIIDLNDRRVLSVVLKHLNEIIYF